MDDLISRQAAIDVLEERLRANGYSNVALVSELNRSIGYLMRLPSAEPKTGHAETASSGVLTPTVWAVCSECKKPIDLWDNYCRSCGARMNGG